MELREAQEIARRVGIDVEFVLREFWELLLLAEIAQQKGPDWVFRGGTALRLAYASPRYSVDLDFSTTASLPPKTFSSFVERWANAHPEIEIRDLWSKRFTHLAEFGIEIRGYIRPIGLKLEVSRREPYPSEKSFSPRLVQSEQMSVQAVLLVARPEQLWLEKLEALKQRHRPLDLFDLWYLKERLEMDQKLPNHSFSRTELRRDLRKYLPRSMHHVVDLLAKRETS